MSTPKRIKEMRMEAHQQEKKDRERRRLFSISTPKKKEFIPYVPKPIYRKDEPQYASAVSNKCEHSASATAKPSRTEYSGDYVTGIAIMHKSNLVPVGRGDNPENYATMRRS